MVGFCLVFSCNLWLIFADRWRIGWLCTSGKGLSTAVISCHFDCCFLHWDHYWSNSLITGLCWCISFGSHIRCCVWTGKEGGACSLFAYCLFPALVLVGLSEMLFGLFTRAELCVSVSVLSSFSFHLHLSWGGKSWGESYVFINLAIGCSQVFDAKLKCALCGSSVYLYPQLWAMQVLSLCWWFLRLGATLVKKRKKTYSYNTVNSSILLFWGWQHYESSLIISLVFENACFDGHVLHIIICNVKLCFLMLAFSGFCHHARCMAVACCKLLNHDVSMFLVQFYAFIFLISCNKQLCLLDCTFCLLSAEEKGC